RRRDRDLPGDLALVDELIELRQIDALSGRRREPLVERNEGEDDQGDQDPGGQSRLRDAGARRPIGPRTARLVRIVVGHGRSIMASTCANDRQRDGVGTGTPAPEARLASSGARYPGDRWRRRHKTTEHSA